MAKLLKAFKTFLETPAGVVLTAIAYGLMVAMILMLLEGEGAFIYEGF